MISLFETIEMLQLVVEFVGFAPSRYYLKECSRYLYRAVSGEVHLRRYAFLEAWDRAVVNPKYLKLRDCDLSDCFIEDLAARSCLPRSVAMECILDGRTVDEFMILEEESLETILLCSIWRMNVSIFDQALKCIRARGYDSQLVSDLLQNPEFQSSLMKADALEFLKRMAEIVPLTEHSLSRSLLLFATQFRARNCLNYLQGLASEGENIDGMLEAHAFAGDSEAVTTLCRKATPATIRSALEQAVGMLHLDIADFLRTEWEKRANPSNSDRRILVVDLLITIAAEAKVEPSVEFLSWLFEGIENMDELLIYRRTLLQFACHNRFRTMCHFLVGRGCTALTFWDPPIALGQNDLLNLVDLCCELNRDVDFKTDPTVELFLLKRGLQVRKNITVGNPIIQVLREGFENASFANRVDLVKYHMTVNPAFATMIDCCNLSNFLRNAFNVTPLGALELFGPPETHIWTGSNVILPADFRPSDIRYKLSINEWTHMRPNEIEIQALRDIRAALVQHGADPEFLFGAGVPLERSLGGKHLEIISIKFIKRVFEGRADVNHKNGEGLTPLSWVLSGWKKIKQEVADILLDYGVDIDATDNCGRTAIFRAIIRDNRSSFDWLIENGADVTLAASDGARPIDAARFFAKTKKCSPEIVGKMEKLCGQTETRDIDGFHSIAF